jgi:hypothetical protein
VLTIRPHRAYVDLPTQTPQTFTGQIERLDRQAESVGVRVKGVIGGAVGSSGSRRDGAAELTSNSCGSIVAVILPDRH